MSTWTSSPGLSSFVASYDAAGGPVQMGQAGQAEAGQDPVHGRGHQAEQVGDAGRSPPAQDADLDDPAFGAGRGPARAVVRAGRPVVHAGVAERSVAVGPPLGGRRGDLEAFGGPAQRVQPSSTTQRASRSRPVSVRGALRWGTRAFRSGVDVAIHTKPEGPHPFKIPQPRPLSPSTTSRDRTPRACFGSPFVARRAALRRPVRALGVPDERPRTGCTRPFVRCGGGGPSRSSEAESGGACRASQQQKGLPKHAQVSRRPGHGRWGPGCPVPGGRPR